MNEDMVLTTKNVEEWCTMLDEEFEEINQDCVSLTKRVKDLSEAFEKLRKEVFAITDEIRRERDGKE